MILNKSWQSVGMRPKTLSDIEQVLKAFGWDLKGNGMSVKESSCLYRRLTPVLYSTEFWNVYWVSEWVLTSPLVVWVRRVSIYGFQLALNESSQVSTQYG